MNYKKYELRELIKIKNGKDYRNEKKGLIPVYGTGGIVDYIDKHIYNGESILLPRKGSLNNIEYIDGKFWTIDTMYWTKINKNIVYGKFLFLYLSLLNITKRNTGSTLPSMTFETYYSLKIPLPEYEKQKKIADFIFMILDKIKNNSQINNNLEELMKTLYQRWFVEFNFPNEEGKPYKASGGKMVWNEELKQEIPEGWSQTKVKTICDVISGYPFNKESYDSNGKYKLITIKNVQDEGVNLNTDNCINDIPENMPDYCLLKPLNILMSLTGNVGRVGIMYSNDCLLNQRVAILKEKNKKQIPFIYSLFKNEYVRKKLENISTGTSQLNLSPIETEKFKIAYNEYIINNFSKITFPYLKKIEQNLEENKWLTELRDFLLPMLMNGQINVDDVEI